MPKLEAEISSAEAQVSQLQQEIEAPKRVAKRVGNGRFEAFSEGDGTPDPQFNGATSP